MDFFSTSAPSISTTIGLIVTVFAAAFTDLTTWRIPNRLLAGAATAAIVTALFAVDGIGIVASLSGGLTGLALLLPLYLLRGTSAGDVKLMATLGLFAGPLLTLDIALMSFLAGGLWSLLYLYFRTNSGLYLLKGLNQVLKPLTNKFSPRFPLNVVPPVLAKGKSGGVIPYGAVIAVGALSALLLARQ